MKPPGRRSGGQAARGAHDLDRPATQKNARQRQAKTQQSQKRGAGAGEMPGAEAVQPKRRGKAAPPQPAVPAVQPAPVKRGAKPIVKAGNAGALIDGVTTGKAGKPARAGSAVARTGRTKGAKTQARLQEALPPALPVQGMSLHDGSGARKYLTADERTTFLHLAEQADRQVRTLCMTLVYAGCRLSEALALTVDRVDLAAGVLVFESLKKRRAGIYRAVPVPPGLLEALNLVHGIREQQASRGKGQRIRLWPWSRMTGWRAIHAVMEEARLSGPHASPKGLRHGFGVAAVTKGIPLNLVQKWLGHAQLSTTAIYANAIGAEEQDIAKWMWG